MSEPDGASPTGDRPTAQPSDGPAHSPTDGQGPAGPPTRHTLSEPDGASPTGDRPPAQPSDGPAHSPTDGEGPAGPPAMEGRLHPSVIALWTLQAFAPLAALWIASSPERMIAVGAVLLTLVGSGVRWLRYRWRIDADQLVITHGLLQRTRRVIPLERIQAVQTVRKIRHRVFGVVGLRIETVGGSEAEGQLDALTPALAAQVQQRLLRTAPAVAQPFAPGAAPEGTVLAQCAPRMLLVAGLTGGRVGAAAAVLAFAQEFAGERIAGAVVSAPQRLGVTLLVVLIALGIAVAFLLSVIATALTYWDFTVTRDGDIIRLRRGLLTDRRDSVPLRRVQSLTVEENVVRRAFGLATVKMVVAGRAGRDEAVSSTLLPITSRAGAFTLAAQVLGVDGLDRMELQPMPPAARARRVVRAVLLVAVATLATWLLLNGPLRLVGLCSALVAVPAALGSYRALGWYQDARVVLARSGWLIRRTTITPALGPQSVRVASSPFQRRRGLATLRLEIARTSAGSDPRLIDVRSDDAERLQRVLIDAQVGNGRATAVRPAPSVAPGARPWLP
ncbi:MAG TPA: PH domain-containing protein [Euzebyales bacterium]|nr:PH domain-containing protein [Euzebyales bacterium]